MWPWRCDLVFKMYCLQDNNKVTSSEGSMRLGSRRRTQTRNAYYCAKPCIEHSLAFKSFVCSAFKVIYSKACGATSSRLLAYLRCRGASASMDHSGSGYTLTAHVCKVHQEHIYAEDLDVTSSLSFALVNPRRAVENAAVVRSVHSTCI